MLFSEPHSSNLASLLFETSPPLSLSLSLSPSLSPCGVHVLSSYQPRQYYEANPELKRAIDMIHDGFFAPDTPDLFHDLTYHLLNYDT